VVNDITIRIVLTLIVMAGFWTEIVDVRGAFLTAEFEQGHQMYVSVPKGFEKYYPGNVVLLLKRTLYGSCQAAIQFWKKLCGIMALVDAQRSKADVCLFFQWTATGLLLYMSWVDDILIAGKKEDVLRAKRSLAQHFTLDEQGEMFEYVGCKVENNRQQRWMKLTQPVMIQSLATMRFSSRFALRIVEEGSTKMVSSRWIFDTVRRCALHPWKMVNHVNDSRSEVHGE
jgi:hypothetical protein